MEKCWDEQIERRTEPSLVRDLPHAFGQQLEGIYHLCSVISSWDLCGNENLELLGSWWFLNASTASVYVLRLPEVALVSKS